METRSFWSKDPFILMRLYTDLVMNGMKADREWNDLAPTMPFVEDYDKHIINLVCHLHINDPSGIAFHNHSSLTTPTELTDKNYLSILKSIQ